MLTENDFRRFNEPEAEPIWLPLAPRLESWDSRSHPAQIALQRYLDHVEVLVAEALHRLGDRTDLALALTIGLEDTASLTRDGRDLDNYLYPVLRRLGHARFATAWARKTHDRQSRITVTESTPAGSPTLAGWKFTALQCTASSQSPAWKQTIADHIPRWEAASEGIELQMAFRVGPRRNWSQLLKPAIDALGGILGLQDGRGPFHPRDDRITRLGLHREVDPSLSNRVQLGVWWREAG